MQGVMPTGCSIRMHPGSRDACVLQARPASLWALMASGQPSIVAGKAMTGEKDADSHYVREPHSLIVCLNNEPCSTNALQTRCSAACMEHSHGSAVRNPHAMHVHPG